MNAEREMLKYVRPSIIETAFTKLIRLGIAILFMTLVYQKTFSVTTRIVFLLIGLYFGAGVFIPRLNFIEVKRELCAVDTSGNIWSLCSLYLYTSEDLARVFSFMLSKNNKIVIGYW